MYLLLVLCKEFCTVLRTYVILVLLHWPQKTVNINTKGANVSEYFDSEVSWLQSKASLGKSCHCALHWYLSWTEACAGSQMAAFYPVWKSPHYQGNRNFPALSLGLHSLLLCYSSGSVIHNVEQQSELWKRRPLFQVSSPCSLRLTSADSRTEQIQTYKQCKIGSKQIT